MTLRIAICDDEDRIGFQIEEYVEKICSSLNLKSDIDVYSTGEGLLRELSEGTCYELIFLDIELETTDGVKVGNTIRNEHNDELTQIVYISWKDSYALQLFDINPLDFLVKPLSYEDVAKVIRRYLKIINFWSDVFTYKYYHDTFKVKLRDIIYLQSSGRKIIIHSKDKTEEFYGSLEEVFNEQLLRADFLMIHKSYIVNFDYVSVFEYDKAILSDKTELPIGQSKRKEIRKRQKEILKRRA
jgi:DNA-binding LytR/AlgR family response regulator